ncbi:MAG: hypothetical protein LUG51_05010 [Tannerellaceae bacterium]|nr:hypothetical protein [Tannerellaceae bacterium]
MKITKFLTFAIALTMFFISCDKEEMEGVEPAETKIETEIGYASLYLEDTAAILTKAIQPGEEVEAPDRRKINTLSFFIFDSNGKRDPVGGYQTFKYSGSQYTFPVAAGEGKTILGAANVEYLGELADASLEEVREILYGRVAERTVDVSVNGTAMAGEVSGVHVRKGNVEVIRICVSDILQANK